MTKNVVFLSGGVGGARFAQALDTWNGEAGNPLACTAIVNVGDDFTHLGMRISPDLDSVAYHLAGLGNRARGWGRAGDTDAVMTEMRRVLPTASWFQLGDLDIAHNLLRTHLLNDGAPLSEVTRILNELYGVRFTVLPVTDAPSPTLVTFPAGGETLRFQEWWVRDQAQPTPSGFAFPEARAARPSPGVIEALASADLIVVAPSNPVVSIDPILAIPGIRAALTNSAAPIVGLSPIIGGRPVRGWLDRCLEAVAVECSAPAIAAYYGNRQDGGLLDGWLADPQDAGTTDTFGGAVAHVPLLFTQDERDLAIIEAVFSLAERITTEAKSGLSV